ncbi:hypothetical protein ACE7GA_01920 [Roseomonas sp. CCTCC AB2023176]|uniref:hypothetical protein n=1 Tax=Roseomonas sp. CCTCC AB2023176 TaxID=3342640 RepID=UPI0035D5326C
MRVVRMRADRSVEVLGECEDFHPPKQPGDTIVVVPSPSRIMDGTGRRLPYSIVNAAAPRMRFTVRSLALAGMAEAVVEIFDDGPHPSFLPGWRPTPA